MENININHKHFIDVICYRCKLRNAEMIIKKAYFMNYDLIIVDLGELFIFFFMKSKINLVLGCPLLRSGWSTSFPFLYYRFLIRRRALFKVIG